MKKETYEKPAVIFETVATTRACSGRKDVDTEKLVDPADLFAKN